MAGHGSAGRGKEQQASKQNNMELTITESKRLVELEGIISQGKQTFVSVGNALAEIRDSKLYRIEHETFEAYCKSKWGWTRGRAYQLMDAAEVAQGMPQEMYKKLDKPSHAAELKKVPAEQREKVLEKAANSAQWEDRPLTAKDIQEAARDEDEPKQTKSAKPDGLRSGSSNKGDTYATGGLNTLTSGDESEPPAAVSPDEDEPEPVERPSVQAANLEDYQDHGQKRDLDVASVRANMEAMITNVCNYGPMGELPAFGRFLIHESRRVFAPTSAHFHEQVMDELIAASTPNDLGKLAAFLEASTKRVKLAHKAHQLKELES